MNKEIHELAIAAGFVAPLFDSTLLNGDVIFDWSNSYDAELQKFADSIIRKCAEIAYGTRGTGEYKEIREYCSREIIKHFGLK
jgi:hypothetical protein